MGDISTAFVTQYSKEVKHAYQQVKPKIVSATTVHRNVKGDTYSFPKLGKITANARSARNADITLITPDHTKVPVSLSDRYAQIALDDFDALKSNVDYRKQYVINTTAAIAREQDSMAVTALDAATMEAGHTITATGGLTKVEILQAAKLLNLQDVAPENRFIVVSPAQLEDALNTAEVTSTDYNIANTMQGLLTGELKSAFGFNWIISNELSVATGVRSCYAFAKDAIGTAMGADISTRIGWDERMQSHLITSKTSLGVGVIDTFGVVKLDVTEA